MFCEDCVTKTGYTHAIIACDLDARTFLICLRGTAHIIFEYLTKVTGVRKPVSWAVLVTLSPLRSQTRLC